MPFDPGKSSGGDWQVQIRGSFRVTFPGTLRSGGIVCKRPAGSSHSHPNSSQQRTRRCFLFFFGYCLASGHFPDLFSVFFFFFFPIFTKPNLQLSKTRLASCKTFKYSLAFCQNCMNLYDAQHFSKLKYCSVKELDIETVKLRKI